jgi:colanic acid/amylovoran biosynthesis protein
MDVFLGTRMHSNIFSLSQNVPLVAIQYNHKTAGIARMAGIEQWVVDINRINDQVLVNKMDRLWVEREQVRGQLSLVIPELQLKALEPAALLASDYALLARGDG